MSPAQHVFVFGALAALEDELANNIIRHTAGDYGAIWR